MAKQVPTFDKMMWPLLQALKEMGGSATIQELLDKVVGLMNLPGEIQNVPHGESSQTEVGYRLAWARTYLRTAGALENSTRGIWSITPVGRKIVEQDIPKVVAKIRQDNRKNREQKKGTPTQTDVDIVDGTGWKEQVLGSLRAMSPDAFERLAQRILRESGFVRVEVTGRTGDGGIDGLGTLRLQLLSFQVFFQCKKYKGAVRAKDIRDFRGAMVGRTDKGIFITMGHFTSDAKEEAARDGAPPLDLIDGEQLCDLLKDLKLGVTTKMVEEVKVHPEVFGSL